MPFRSICVYAGSNPGDDPTHAETARALGTLLAERGIGVVYGGGRTGLMGAVADATLAAGGTVVGIIPAHLEEREVAHRGLTELVVVGSMHERKTLMAERADAFVALPGGLGTLEELVEVATWTQLGIHDKPVGLLDSAGYWRPLDAFLEHAVAAGFLHPEHRKAIVREDDPAAMLDALEAWRPVQVQKWLELDER
ncbi:TIGR00730 family Rossman fold protein [Patulibacter americanus]|uniref:LOG family protein n=1 Tax=Patulibacter americanus TaxID=588672 RepID=UPI0003B6F741|nr:TIGR00730 family Rossman fold protein [Patulibacter americanus]